MEKATPEQNLIKLYGEDVLEKVVQEIEELKKNSNIPFDKAYMNLGLSFIGIKAEEIVEGKEKKTSLKSLVSSSFGEAAIYKYNVAGGVL